ncbi:arsenical pump-driving ATPase [Adhaeretor mobilis]|uniref:arsenite-transporting ATPase n=1 Tax=Adhaeretor mobilis TaxID=1930276 RepID=A0A517MZ09_9BACT|nr:arsenical pump-driving ATPase [Adhaeretor mobilis]QDT00105.1 Arsenical pump-driving ATPase [Adhaeretor mobilis]
MRFLKEPTRNLFFTGKGGVGKTSMACATAIQLADKGLRVLLVSTDPASNLDEVLQTPLRNTPTPIAAVPNLMGMNIDPETAAAEYRERMVSPYRDTLPEAAIKSMEEQFSGSCTLEIAAFDEFSRLLGDGQATSEFDHIVFDTAPTGHTLRLLTLPTAWSGFIEGNTTGTSCLGPLAGLQAQQQIYQKTVESLSNPELTTLVLVTRPEPSAFREAARTSLELKHLEVSNQHLIVNGVFSCESSTDPIATAMQLRGNQAIGSMPEEVNKLPRTTVALAPSGLMGVESLRKISTPSGNSFASVTNKVSSYSLPAGLAPLIDDFAQMGRGVIMTMGKGGVGKTTIAAAVAVALAERGFEVHLSTTDPAAHVATMLAQEELTGLTVGRIDPAEETAKYALEVMQAAGPSLDAAGKALLEEDLRSPCTEEIAVFRAFAKAVSEGADRFVVLDTAPTGHTILLLDSALAYHREVTRQSNQMPETVEKLLPRLRDPDFTRVLIATLPEATPVHEAAQLQEDLRRAGIDPFAWVINQSLLPLDISDPILRQRQHHELPFVEEVKSSLAKRVALIPWQTEPPIGLAGMRSVAEPTTIAAH